MKRSELDIYNRFGIISANIKEILVLADYLDSLRMIYWLGELKKDWMVGKYRLKIEIPFPELLLKPMEFFTYFTNKINRIIENYSDSFELYWVSGLLNSSVRKGGIEEDIWEINQARVYNLSYFPKVLDVSSMLFSQNPVLNNRLRFLINSGRVYVRNNERLDYYNKDLNNKIRIGGVTYIPVNKLNPFSIIRFKTELGGEIKYNITRKDFYCFSDGLFIENEEITKIVSPMLRSYLIDISNSDDYLIS